MSLTITEADYTRLALTVVTEAWKLPKYGQNKVWIADLLDAMGVKAREQFKSWLVHMHTSGLIELARCDLNTRETRAKQDASETSHPLGYTFHFIKL
jgi:hypothetical protein